MTVATPSEITGLSIALSNTDQQIDKALDERNQRAFALWSQRRRSLLAKLERTLLAVATAKTPCMTMIDLSVSPGETLASANGGDHDAHMRRPRRACPDRHDRPVALPVWVWPGVLRVRNLRRRGQRAGCAPQQEGHLMPATLQFVVYLLALLCLLAAALAPLRARQAPHFGWLGLALVTLVPLAAVAQAAF